MAHNHEKGLCLVVHKDKLIFLAVSSNASTSIRNALGIINYNNNYLSILKSNYKEKCYTTFTIIRNPINRLISGYQKICYRATRDSPNILKNKFYWVVDQKKRFYTFIDELERGFFDCHIELQYFYLSDQNEKLFDIDYYLKVEQLDIDFSKMCQKLKLNYSLLHFNEASKREKSNMINNLINSINILVKMLKNILYIIFNQSLTKETLLSMYQNIFNRIKYVFIRRPLPSAIDIWSLIQEDNILQQRIYNLYEKDFDLYFNN